MMLRFFLLISALFSLALAEASGSGNPHLSGLKIDVVGEAHQQETLRILLLLRDLQISSEPLKGRYNQNILGTDFWGFFIKRIHTVAEAPAIDSHCAGGAMAYVEQESSPNTAFVCPLFFDKYFSDYEKAAVLLHEARHTEGHPHVMCLAGNKAANSGGCDERIEDQGAYAVTSEAMAKIAMRGINVPEAEREKMRLNLLVYLESFNESVQGIGNSGIYLESQDGKQAYIFDGVSLASVPKLAKTHFVSRTLSLIALPESKADGFGVDIFKKGLNKIPAAGGCVLEYNRQAPKDRKMLIDIVADGPFSACIYENSIVGRIDGKDGVDAKIEIPGKIRAVFTSDEVFESQRDSFFVRNNKNETYRVRFTEKETFEISKVQDPSKSFNRLFFFNNDLTGLKEDGRLMKIDFETNDWIAVPGLEKMRFKSSTRPFLWSKDLVE